MSIDAKLTKFDKSKVKEVEHQLPLLLASAKSWLNGWNEDGIVRPNQVLGNFVELRRYINMARGLRVMSTETMQQHIEDYKETFRDALKLVPEIGDYAAYKRI
jgi:hypothetical protein|tara:strand:- start:2655 stop:2963 length:309 start_codon:yes stop_codon:yes gene_type:complete